MSSTDLITYLNYISTWETETDENINSLISEHNLFLNLNSFDSDSVVENEFGVLVDLADEVRNKTIAADVIQIAADAAAVASIWSFGLSMAAFAVLEAEEVIARAVISSESGELNDKLSTIDTDISSQINPNVNSYIVQFKANNNLIASKAPAGIDTRTCRSLLVQFMAEVQRRNRTVDAAAFKKYAESARILYNSSEINKVYDALDVLNLSDRADPDVKQFMGVLAGLDYPAELLSFIRNFSIGIMAYKLKIANDTIETQAKAAGLPVEEVESDVFGLMDAVGKVATVTAVAMSVVDVVLQIIDIVDVVEQCNKLCEELGSTIKDSYKSYFSGIMTAAQQYKAAIATPQGT
jgi:hypothetical protein